MYLTKNQIYDYAVEILERIGRADGVRDVVYGGIERYDYYYVGYGLSISKIDGRVEIVYEYGELVYRSFGPDNVPRYVPGDWELILKELFGSISDILVERRIKEDEEKRRARVWEETRQKIMACLNFLPMERINYSIAFGNSGKSTYAYEDEVVEVVEYSSGDSYCGTHTRVVVYEFYYIQEKHWYGVRQEKRSRTVFDSSDKNVFLEGSWCDHLSAVAEMARVKERTAWEKSIPTAEERIRQIRKNN